MKLLIAEQGSAIAISAWTSADAVVAGRLLYPEARAALAAALRGGRIPNPVYPGRVAGLEALWRQLDVIEVTSVVAAAAGDLAEQQAVRGYDAVHLAAALHIPADMIVTADDDLRRAASTLGITVIDARG